MNVLILFPLKCSKRRLISSSLDEILYIRVCQVLTVDQHIFQVFLAGKTEEGYVSERWGRACHFTHWIHTNTYSLFKSFLEIQYWRVQLSQRQRFSYNRINSHQNSFILWRWSCDYMKEEPIHSVGEWTAYFQWLPRNTRKHWCLVIPLQTSPEATCSLYSLIWMSLF